MEAFEQVSRGQVPAELRRWNWGAFGLTWIWGIGNRTPAAWFTFVPFVGWLVMPFVLGLKGNQWAWRNRSWPDIETFRRTQRAWARWALVAWAGAAVAVILLVTLTTSMMATSEPYQIAQAELTSDSKIIELLGQPIELGTPTGKMSSAAGGTGEAQLQFSVSGPKAQGKAYITAIKELGAWRVDRIAVDLENGTRIERQSSPPATN